MSELLKGFISADEGLREALEFITGLKEVNSGVLEITSKTVSGRVGIAWGRFVTGALTEEGLWGKKALRRLLTVRQGKFSFVDKQGEPVEELRQSLGIDLNGVFPYVPLEILPTVTPWLFEPGEEADAPVAAPINLMDTVDIDKPDLAELQNPISPAAARAAAYLPPMEDAQPAEKLVQDPLADVVQEPEEQQTQIEEEQATPHTIAVDDTGPLPRDAGLAAAYAQSVDDEQMGSAHQHTPLLIELDPVSDPLVQKISQRIADIAAVQMQPETQLENEPELPAFAKSTGAHDKKIDETTLHDLQPPLPKLGKPAPTDLPEPPLTATSLSQPVQSLQTPGMTSDIIRPPDVFNPLETPARAESDMGAQGAFDVRPPAVRRTLTRITHPILKTLSSQSAKNDAEAAEPAAETYKPVNLPPVPSMHLPTGRQSAGRLLPPGAVPIEMPGTAEPPSRMSRQRTQNTNSDAVGIAIVCVLFFVVSCAGTVAFGPRVWAVVSSVMQTH